MRACASPRRDGLTIVELLVAMIVFSIVFTITLGTMQEQLRAFTNGQRQLDAAQYTRFTLATLEKDLPTLGTNVPNEQPFIVYADSQVIAFNTNFLSNLPGDPFSVYVDSTMPDSVTMSLPQTRKFTLPQTAFAYPDTTYRVGATQSAAETIIFYFQLDTSTPRVDDWMLWRQVNDRPAELVARNVLKAANRPFFRYHRVVTPGSGPAYLDSIPTAWQPLRHAVPIHNAVGDTVPFNRIDQIRAIEITFRITDARPGTQERIYDVRRRITLPNAGKESKKTCGDEPLLGAVAFTATPFIDPITADTMLRVTWNAAVDQTSGERDVVRYLVWRDTLSFMSAANPYLNLAAGTATYQFDDTDVISGKRYYYAMAAQDCTPSLSNLALTNAIVP